MKRIITILTISFLLTACADEAQSPASETTTAVVGESKLEKVSKEAFASFVKEHSNVQIIDVRTPEEYNDGYIPNAQNIDFNSADFKSKIEALDKNKPVAIYCHSGGRSGKALEMMKTMNFANVVELEGGYSNYISPGN